MTKNTISKSLIVLAIVLAFLIPVIFHGPIVPHVGVIIAMNIILASSLRLIYLTGQMSLAHGSMMTIGAYTSTLLVMKLGVSSWVGLLAAGLLASLFGCLIGYPLVRLKGIYFTMVTVFLGQIATLFIQQWADVTGGTNGIFNIPGPDPIAIGNILNIKFVTNSDFYYLILVIMLASLVLLYFIERSRIGLIFRSIQQADSLSESVGINTIWYKVVAFSIGCFFAGITGGFYSQYISTINTNTFGFLATIYVVIYMIVGGTGSFFGPIIGVIFLGMLPELTRFLKTYQPFLFAGILIVVIFLMPKGLAGIPDMLKSAIKKFRVRGAQNAGN
jgi:branched-chain amino acid transport system permease protein